ncbi:MAG: sulfite exporter TauE/SafE family protein [Anaerolineae bacterium]|nr:sulfite exporter TauE/SafE family protein [Anaerolineae bacterium]
MWHYWWLIPLGFVVAAYGTLIGAGGGFVLVPALLLLYPNEKPEVVTSISLAVVFFNALSGSVAYGRMRRVHYRSGLLFSAATVPGAILGALTTSFIPRQEFNLIFAVVLILGSVFLLLRPNAEQEAAGPLPRRHLACHLVEADGTSHAFGYDPVVGVMLSMVVGYVSSLLGIGGGIIHVPALVYLLHFPTHIACATSHFILAMTALAGTATHIATGAFSVGIRRTILLAAGALVGAQVGAALSRRVHGTWIMRGLAIALLLVGVRILILAG